MIVDIPKDVKFILTELEIMGFESYIVGGCVRDCLLGKEPKDWDVCTNALPSEILEVFNQYKVIETGLQHGTVTVVIGDVGYEITTYRIDGKYSDGRRPDSVQFTNDIKEDLSRRDFTINAMAYHPSKGLIDPFNGRLDLNSRTIRCVGDSEKRFKEDGLRILRALRFASVYRFKIHQDTATKILEHKELLANVSAERINSEFTKILLGKDVFLLIPFKEVFAEFIPEIRPLFTDMIPTFNCTLHTNRWEQIVSNIIDCMENHIGLKLSLIVGYITWNKGEAEALLKRLKYDNTVIKMVLGCYDYRLSDADDMCHNVKIALSNYGFENLSNMLYLKSVENKNNRSHFKNYTDVLLSTIQYRMNKIIQNNECYSLKQLNINGDDLIQIGFKQGIEIKYILSHILYEVIMGNIDNDKNVLIKYAKLKIE